MTLPTVTLHFKGMTKAIIALIKHRAPNRSMTVCCSNTDQYSKDVEGKLNVVFVVRLTKMLGNIGNDQEYKV